jgi:hypothetical protein
MLKKIFEEARDFLFWSSPLGSLKLYKLVEDKKSSYIGDAIAKSLGWCVTLYSCYKGYYDSGLILSTILMFSATIDKLKYIDIETELKLEELEGI